MPENEKTKDKSEKNYTKILVHDLLPEKEKKPIIFGQKDHSSKDEKEPPKE